MPFPIKHINPLASTNGNGEFSTPYNTWGSGAWWVPGTRYLQTERVPFNGTVSVNTGITTSAEAPIILGTYDSQTGEQIQDGTRHALIRPSSGHGIQIGTQKWVTIDNLDCAGGDRTQTLNDGITGNAPTGDTATNRTIIRCVADGRYGIALTGSEDYVGYSVIYGRTDGLSSNGVVFTAEYNDIIGQDISTANYDGITHLDSGLPIVQLLLRRNRIIDYAGSLKQGIYLASNEVPSGSAIVEDNYIAGFTQCLLTYTPGAVLRRNRITKPRLIAGGSEGAITLNAGNCIVSDNLLHDIAGRALTCGGYTGNIITGNSAIRVSEGWVFNSGTIGATLINNALVRSAGSVANMLVRISTVTLTRSNNLYYAPDGATQFNDGGNIRDTFAEYQAGASEAGALGVDPLLSSGFRPLPGSPLLRAGTYIAD